MDGKLYIKKFIRDDGETLELDANELYLADDNVLLIRPDPSTTAIEYAGADGGEMIRQRNAIYSQTINGLLVPKTTEYWALCSRLSQFFQINHIYKIVYVKKDGGMFAVQDAWISSGLQIEPRPYETYSEWNITLNIGNTGWTEYAEDSSGKEIFSNTIILPLLTANAGGEIWEAPTTQQLSGEGSSFSIAGVVLGASISDLKVIGDASQALYTGKNLLKGSPWVTISTGAGYPTHTSSGVTINSSDDNDINFTTTTAYRGLESDYIPIGNNTTITVSFANTTSNRFFITQYDNSKNRVGTLNPNPSVVGATTVTTTQDGYVTVAFSTTSTGTFDVKNIQIEASSFATLYEPYCGGIPSPNPDYTQEAKVVAGTQTVTLSDNVNTQSFTINLGSISLCKIGSYQDYIYKGNDGWYLHKECKSIIIPSTGWTIFGSGHSTFYTTGITDYATSANIPICEAFRGHDNVEGVYGADASPDNSCMFINVSGGTTPRFYIKSSKFATASALSTYLSTNEPVMWYALETPSDTKITDATLISDLDALYGASLYAGTDYFAVAATSLPGILSLVITQLSGGGEVWGNVGGAWELGSGGVQTINIASTQVVYPVWTVEGPCTNPTIQNDTTDSLASFNGSIASGQTLVVDFATGAAYLDSALVTRYVAGGLSLTPGDNIVGFNTDGGTTETSIIEWNNTIN